jgi:hypothetical protein
VCALPQQILRPFLFPRNGTDLASWPLLREREKKKKKSLVIVRPFSFLVIEKKQAAFSIFKRLDIYQGNMNNTPSEARFYEIISPFSSYCFSLGSS